MVGLAAWLLAAALAGPVPQADRAEDPGARAERLAVVALAVARETDRALAEGRWPAGGRRTLAAAALATAVEEGWHFRRDVHAGRKLADGGRTICFMGIHQANSVAYGSRRPNVRAWRKLGGTDLEASQRCARAGIRSLARARRHCIGRRYRRNWAPAMFSLYATGNRCWLWRGAHRRTGRMWRYRSHRKAPAELLELVRRAAGDPTGPISAHPGDRCRPAVRR